ncbi:MAG TPA: threonine/serine exporter family protein, partial [Xanthobacteraceae bacterium]
SLSISPPPPPQFDELSLLGLRALASFAGGCGFAILYNSTHRTVLTVGCLALVGNELRLALHDAGMQLALATFLGALTVGLLASAARPWLREPRIALTVPGIIIMVPGTYAFQTVVLLDEGNVLAALRAASLGAFVVGAMALGLAAARLVSQRGWIVES